MQGGTLLLRRPNQTPRPPVFFRPWTWLISPAAIVSAALDGPNRTQPVARFADWEINSGDFGQASPVIRLDRGFSCYRVLT
ncbi:hypothetical protein K239x_23560 [Planctomycetes bacterium K23_9]|uniref:Uncharacterized protein n=1 Tax=Stieleria marina TaxID=1930275 RepID=A0A517NTF3_9BACT|nr:hypothetical protein K239x_23560 [Planctomycetes bacterium K23_9]